MTNAIPATLIPGDGIGPEIVDATVQVLDALGARFEWETCKAGMAGVKEFGDPLPEPTLASIRRSCSSMREPEVGGFTGTLRWRGRYWPA